MKHASSHTVKLLNEERALLMSLAATRDVTYSDILRLGLYQLAATDGLQAQVIQPSRRVWTICLRWKRPGAASGSSLPSNHLHSYPHTQEPSNGEGHLGQRP